MIINAFQKKITNNTKKLESEDKIPNDLKFSDAEEINMHLMQKYIIDNYIEYIKQENYSILSEKIEQYIYNNSKSIRAENIAQIKKNLLNKMFGYHILQKYIDNENVSDIRAVRYNFVFIKEKGKWKKTDTSFKDDNEFYEYIRYCVLRNNSNINFDTPIIIVSDKKYNLRIEAGISPVNALSPSLVIRIHRYNKKITLESVFLKEDMINANAYKLLNQAIENEKNIVICGKGGSGKTTLLRALIEKIPSDKPITTNEQTIELYIEGKNIIQREVVENRENSKEITLEVLTRHSLVMSNDVIIIRRIKTVKRVHFFLMRCQLDILVLLQYILTVQVV